MRRFSGKRILLAISIASFLAVGRPILAVSPEPTHRAIIDRVTPVYPELAKRMRISGTVIIHATVLPDGTVSETHVETGHALLRQAAEEAVHHWRFAAASNASECIVTVGFELPH